jgi:hypothetical protein
MSTSTQSLSDIKDEAYRNTMERLAEEFAKQGRQINRREAKPQAKIENTGTTAQSAPKAKEKETVNVTT